MAELAQNENRFKDKNANLAVIGSGEPEHFSEFRNITGYNGQLFTDPSLSAFATLRFKNSVTGILSPRTLRNAAAAFKSGYRQGSVQGSTLQLGGAIVIDTEGHVLYFFASSKAGDHPQIDELIKALENEAGSGALC